MKTINRLLTAGTASMAAHAALLWGMGVSVPDCSPEYFPVQEPELVMVETPDVEETLEEVVEEVPEDIDFGERQRAKAAPAQPQAQRKSYAAPIKRIDTTTAVNAILDGEMSPTEAYTRSHGVGERNQDTYEAFFFEYLDRHKSRVLRAHSYNHSTSYQERENSPPEVKVVCTTQKAVTKREQIRIGQEGYFTVPRIIPNRFFFDSFDSQQLELFRKSFRTLPQPFVPPSVVGVLGDFMTTHTIGVAICEYIPIEVEE